MANIEIEVGEVLDSCNTWEMEEAIETIVKNCAEDEDLEDTLRECIRTHFPDDNRIEFPRRMSKGGNSYDFEEFRTSLIALLDSYYSLDNEKVSRINEMAKKYK